MKKNVYIFLFVVLGIIFSFLVHAVVEMWYIELLTSDFNRYGLGLSWDQWFIVHHTLSVVLLVLGIVIGYFQGKHWWQVIYSKKS